MLMVEGIAELGPKQVIVPPDVFDSRPHLYSQAIKTGNAIYVSGQVSCDAKGNIVGRGDFEVQMGMSLENMKHTLAAAGATMDEVIFMHMFSKDERYMHRDSYTRVWTKYFHSPFPACTSIQYGNLAVRGLMTEFDGIAEIGRQETIRPPDVADSIPGQLYPQATKVNNRIYVSGQTSWDEKGNSVGQGDFETQTRVVYENMRRTLKAAGAEMSNVVKLGIFTRDMRLIRRGQYGKIFKEFFGNHCPAVTAVQVDNFWRSDYMLEIEAIAVV
jgi:enamine deaminase RidA (YjgF/YER057c/UK114 family)